MGATREPASLPQHSTSDGQKAAVQFELDIDVADRTRSCQLGLNRIKLNTHTSSSTHIAAHQAEKGRRLPDRGIGAHDYATRNLALAILTGQVRLATRARTGGAAKVSLHSTLTSTVTVQTNTPGASETSAHT